MRRMEICAIVLAVTSAFSVRPGQAAQAGLSNRERQQHEQELRHAIADLLDGCIAVVRVYPDAVNAPETFEKIRVAITVQPIERRAGARAVSISHKAVKTAYPAISTAAYVVFLGTDQSDETIVTVLPRYVQISPYRDDSRLSLNLGLQDAPSEPWWTFVDASGRPIAGATVNVEYPIAKPGDALYLGEVVLDKQGRLQPLRSFEPLIFTVTHPDYGIARVDYRGPKPPPAGIHVVPLLRFDSPQIAASIEGTVVDNEDRPIPKAMIRCSGLLDMNGQLLKGDRRYYYDAVTDDQGWFSLCLPLVADDFSLVGLPTTGTRYALDIRPPRQSHFRKSGGFFAQAGTRTTFELTPIEAQKTFHTFAFEYDEGPVTNPEELSHMTLTLLRDERPWVHLTYDQFKAGYALPSGTLRAGTKRWGRSFEFQEVNLTSDSLEHLVIRARAPILYRGQVVDDATGAPVPGALVLADHALARTDATTLTKDQWQLLHKQAADGSLETLYRMQDRVTITDADGYYELLFLPSMRRGLQTFTAKTVEHPRADTDATSEDPNADGVAELRTIRLSPSIAPPYKPTIVVRTDEGVVTDSEKLGAIEIVTDHGSSATGTMKLSRLSNVGLNPGVYFAEAIWDRTLYIFEPVDLTESRPDVVVFSVQETRPAHVIYRGQVVHGITGQPIHKALVVRDTYATRDASGLEPGQWKAIKALGPHPDPADPALVPLWSKLSGRSDDRAGPCTLTDENGWFRIEFQHPALRDREALRILDEDFLGCIQQLQFFNTSRDRPKNRRFIEPLVPDENGFVTLGPLRMFPGGTLVIHPVIPDFGSRRNREPLRLVRRVCGGPQPVWLQDAFPPVSERLGAGLSRQIELRPNLTQTVYILAGVDQDFTLSHQSADPPPPLSLGPMRFEQGQVIDLGRVEFDESIVVTVKVVDQEGTPISGLNIYRIDQRGKGGRIGRQTDGEGRVPVKVATHSTGRFCFIYDDYEIHKRIEECVPFVVGGEEDAGREFTLTLSDEMVERLAQPRR